MRLGLRRFPLPLGLRQRHLHHQGPAARLRRLPGHGGPVPRALRPARGRKDHPAAGLRALQPLANVPRGWFTAETATATSDGSEPGVTTLPASPAPEGPDAPPDAVRGRSSRLVAGALAAGFLAALLLAAAPVLPATESGVTGGLLLGFALGWALLAVLSGFTDQPQRWAAAPALFLGSGGLLLVVFGAPMQEALAWVWPPALLVLVVWMVVRIRSATGRSTRALLYPVLALLVVAALAAWARDRPCSRQRGSHPGARAPDRRRQSPPVPRLHGRGQPHRGDRAGCGPGVVGPRPDRTDRRPGHPGLRLRPGGARMERAGEPPRRTPHGSPPICTRSWSVPTSRDRT